MEKQIVRTPTPAQAELVTAFQTLNKTPRSRSEWMRTNFFHGMFTYEGMLNMDLRGRDCFHLLSFPHALTATKSLSCARALVRERCNNVMFFCQRLTLRQIFMGLSRLKRMPVEPWFAEFVHDCLIEPQHRFCLRKSPRNRFVIVDRLTAMGGAEGGWSFLQLGELAGALVQLAAKEAEGFVPPSSEPEDVQGPFRFGPQPKEIPFSTFRICEPFA